MSNCAQTQQNHNTYVLYCLEFYLTQDNFVNRRAIDIFHVCFAAGSGSGSGSGSCTVQLWQSNCTAVVVKLYSRGSQGVQLW